MMSLYRLISCHHLLWMVPLYTLLDPAQHAYLFLLPYYIHNEYIYQHICIYLPCKVLLFFTLFQFTLYMINTTYLIHAIDLPNSIHKLNVIVQDLLLNVQYVSFLSLMFLLMLLIHFDLQRPI
jgi:hypothetical protein